MTVKKKYGWIVKFMKLTPLMFSSMKKYPTIVINFIKYNKIEVQMGIKEA